MIAKSIASIVLLFGSPLAHADEIRPGILRTPEARFAGLEGYPFDSHYMESGAPVTETQGDHFLQEEVPTEIAEAFLRVVEQAPSSKP